jgi:hypothetical protein
MGAFVYCLYSSEDGHPRYVDCVDGRVGFRYKQHITAALDQEAGVLNEWIRDTWRRDFDIGFFTLQEGVQPDDQEMFKRYWTNQFVNLLDASAGSAPATNSATAEQIIAAIRAQLDLVRRS